MSELAQTAMQTMPFAKAGLALVVSAASAPLVLWVLAKANSRHTVAHFTPEHAEKSGIPTMGGLMVLLGIIAALLASGDAWSFSALWILLGFGLVGFADDYLVQKLSPKKRGLDWAPKLALQSAAVVLACWAAGVTDPVWVAIAWVVVLFWSNAFNFADGMDGLACSLAVVLGGSLFLLGVLYADPGSPAIPLSLAIAAAMLPFLLLNAYPAKVFMGDIGALPVGALFGWVCLSLLQPDQPMAFLLPIPLLLLSLVMVVELVPVPLQIASVKLLGRRMFSFKTPIHHGMHALGIPETRVVAYLVTAQAVCALLAFFAAEALLRAGGGR